jgi:(p)ppGpp synthase/HD superfamily hydrolase
MKYTTHAVMIATLILVWTVNNADCFKMSTLYSSAVRRMNTRRSYKNNNEYTVLYDSAYGEDDVTTSASADTRNDDIETSKEKHLHSAQGDFFSSVPFVNDMYFGKLDAADLKHFNDVDNFATVVGASNFPDKQQHHNTVPTLGAWKSLSLLNDDLLPPPSLLAYLRGEDKFSPHDKIKVMELWDEFQKMRCVRAFSRRDSSKILFALKVAYAGFHEKRIERCGEMCIERAKGTAFVLGELNADANVVIAGILHNIFSQVPEDEIPAIRYLLKMQLGSSVVSLVDKVNELPTFLAKKAQYSPFQSEYHIQMLVATAQDYRALIVRLAERLHTMRSIKTLKLDSGEKAKIAQEALHVYAPLAHKMSVMKIKGELEDLAFRTIDPAMFHLSRYTQIAASKAFQRAADQLKELIATDELIAANNATCKLTYRIKDKYQLFLKMKRKHLDNPNEVRDALGLRIIVDVPRIGDESYEGFQQRSHKVCYNLVNRLRALDGWIPTVNGLKDYIAEPKENGYQSIHQYIKNKALGTNVEVQVRTKDMHVQAELGEAAHWFYKDRIYRPEVANSKAYNIAWRSSQQLKSQSPVELIGMARHQLDSKRVFVFLEDKSTVLNLRKGSTALDAAFKVHSTLGLTASSVKVKGKRSSLSRPLQHGDVIAVEKTPDGQVTAKPSWVDLVKSPNSLAAMRRYFKDKERNSTFCLGMIQFLVSIDINEDLIRQRHGTMLNARQIIERVPSNTQFRNLKELFLCLGTAKQIEACAVLSRLFDVDVKNFRMVPLSKGLSWATLMSNRNYRDPMDAKQSKRELNQYLLEELIIPILYGAVPYLGFNPRHGWASLGLNLPLQIKNSSSTMSSPSRRKNKISMNEECLQPRGQTRNIPIKLTNTMNKIFVGKRDALGVPVVTSPYILEANKFIVSEVKNEYVKQKIIDAE